jgi:alcohol dehydrogenase
VLVDVAAACVLPYAAEVFSGARSYPLEPPVIPGTGGVGRVAAIGPDATRLEVGDWVWCDPMVRSRDDALAPDITIQGCSSRGEGGHRLSRYFHDGAFAEQMVVPTENAVTLGAIEPDRAARWSALSVLLVPYCGLLAADLRAGETLLVSGATGNFGSAGIAVALAMGAGCVVATGRNQTVLPDLERRFGDRVRTVALTREEDTDRAAMTVREYGRVVLMGGVGMLGGEDLALPYPWIMRNSITLRGQWMCPRTANRQIANLVCSGLLDLSDEDVTTFSLDDANEAVAHAAAHGGPFQRTVITP